MLYLCIAIFVVITLVRIGAQSTIKIADDSESADIDLSTTEGIALVF